ncbi:hypothetical protein PoB_002250400 [Plakobranchus ocellatus]|uniref:Uncharacterized protein n=1 Tax=Plakobranchus ocellatus TaxID=259542 RepID=A0AAV3ZL10_9GAST|nr:hypothetical protein PoB_002250400 [Plakobranchus ocellatus]
MFRGNKTHVGNVGVENDTTVRDGREVAALHEIIAPPLQAMETTLVLEGRRRWSSSPQARRRKKRSELGCTCNHLIKYKCPISIRGFVAKSEGRRMVIYRQTKHPVQFILSTILKI